MHRLNKDFWLLLLLLLGFAGLHQPALGQDDELTASVDRREVSANETLTLRVRYTGRASGGQPDFSQLEENFEIISQRQSNQMSVVNGVMSSFTEWTLTLAPRRTGELLVPSFRYQDRFSDAIQVTVTEAQETPGQLRDLFIETLVDDEEVYVQQQVVLTYRLYTARSIESLDAEPLDIDGVRIEELPEARYQRRIDGVTYGVLEVRYALFPQRSETFTIPPQTWTVRATTGASRNLYGFGSGRYELKRLRTAEKTIQVAPKPASYPADATWLPAAKLDLTEEWSKTPGEFEVGQPVTRTIRLRAEGLSAEQLPPLALGEAPPGVKYYPDQAKQDNETVAEGVTGTRTESVAIVPGQPGELTLPAIEVRWWDIEEEQLRTAELPARTVYVQGGAAEPANPSTESPAVETPADAGDTAADDKAATTPSPTALPWQIATLLLAMACLALALLWWRSRQVPARREESLPSRPQSSTVEKEAWRQLQKTADSGDLRRLRMALLAWGASRWPDAPPRSLEELADLINTRPVTEGLGALDAALYGRGGTAPDPAALVQAIQGWRRSAPPSTAADRSRSLKPLY